MSLAERRHLWRQHLTLQSEMLCPAPSLSDPSWVSGSELSPGQQGGWEAVIPAILPGTKSRARNTEEHQSGFQGH